MLYNRTMLAALVLVMRADARSPSDGVRRRLVGGGLQGPLETTNISDQKLIKSLKKAGYAEHGGKWTVKKKEDYGINMCCEKPLCSSKCRTMQKCLSGVTGGTVCGKRSKAIAKASIKNSKTAEFYMRIEVIVSEEEKIAQLLKGLEDYNVTLETEILETDPINDEEKAEPGDNETQDVQTKEPKKYLAGINSNNIEQIRKTIKEILKLTPGEYEQQFKEASLKTDMEDAYNKDVKCGEECWWCVSTLGLGVSRRVRFWFSALYTSAVATLWTMAAMIAVPSWVAHDDKKNPEGVNSSQLDDNFAIQLYKKSELFGREAELREYDAIEFNVKNKEVDDLDALEQKLFRKFFPAEATLAEKDENNDIDNEIIQEYISRRKPVSMFNGSDETTFEIAVNKLDKDTLEHLGVKKQLRGMYTEEQILVRSNGSPVETEEVTNVLKELEIDDTITELDETQLTTLREKGYDVYNMKFDAPEGGERTYEQLLWSKSLSNDANDMSSGLKIEEYIGDEETSIMDMMGKSGEIKYDPSIDHCHREMDFLYVNAFFGVMTILLLLCAWTCLSSYNKLSKEDGQPRKFGNCFGCSKAVCGPPGIKDSRV